MVAHIPLILPKGKEPYGNHASVKYNSFENITKYHEFYARLSEIIFQTHAASVGVWVLRAILSEESVKLLQYSE
jgi:hypothetical protein